MVSKCIFWKKKYFLFFQVYVAYDMISNKSILCEFNINFL